MEGIKKRIKQLEKQQKVTRDEIQNICSDLKHININVLLTLAPRVGKTRCALNILNEGERVLVCSNSQLIRDKWTLELNKWGFEGKSICYQSVKKELNEYDVIVLDESDLCSDGYFEILKEFNPKRWIWLTGTPTYRLRRFWNKIGGGFEWEITTQQAINWGILPKPEIICKGITLKNDKRYLLYYKGKDSKKKNDIVQYNSPEFWTSIRDKKTNTLIQCTEHEWNQLSERDVKYWTDVLNDEESKVSKTVAGNMLNVIGNQRKKMFAELKNKFIKKAITKYGLDDKRVLIFCNSIPQAEWFGSEFSIHSQKKDTQALEDFNSGKTSKLISIGLLERGVDIYNADACLLIQAGNSEASMKQKSSRVLLSLAPKIIILYYKNTRDEEYVKKFASQFTDVVWE
jgi:superfamily II DNA or RNA helicase